MRGRTQTIAVKVVTPINVGWFVCNIRQNYRVRCNVRQPTSPQLLITSHGYPPETTHTHPTSCLISARLEDLCLCLVVGQQHLLARRMHRVEILCDRPCQGQMSFLHPASVCHTNTDLALISTHQRVHWVLYSLNVLVPMWPCLCGGRLCPRSPAEG